MWGHADTDNDAVTRITSPPRIRIARTRAVSARTGTGLAIQVPRAPTHDSAGRRGPRGSSQSPRRIFSSFEDIRARPFRRGRGEGPRPAGPGGQRPTGQGILAMLLQ